MFCFPMIYSNLLLKYRVHSGECRLQSRCQPPHQRYSRSHRFSGRFQCLNPVTAGCLLLVCVCVPTDLLCESLAVCRVYLRSVALAVDDHEDSNLILLSLICAEKRILAKQTKTIIGPEKIHRFAIDKVVQLC